MKLGIVIGHSPTSPGAVNKNLKVNEYFLNVELGTAILSECIKRNIDAELIYRKNGYGNLPKDINSTGVDYCICVHHNGASNEYINGNETLHYHKSKVSTMFAKCVNDKMFSVLRYKNRGLKSVDSEDRGGTVLKYTVMPCILIEPYFMTNDKATKERSPEALAEAIVDGYENFLKELNK